MPEYLSPGVYIEETSYRAKSIQGVATSTAGFVGPCRSGPVQGRPRLVTSFEEFRRVFGGLDDLLLTPAGSTTPDTVTNYLAHAVKAFFDNGGQRVYIARLLGLNATFTTPEAAIEGFRAKMAKQYQADSASNVDFVAAGGGAIQPRFVARDAGRAGNLPVTVTAQRSGNLLGTTGGIKTLQGVRSGDVVEVGSGSPKGRAVTLVAPVAPATDDRLDSTQVHVVKVDDQGVPSLYLPGAAAALDLTTIAWAQRVTISVMVGTKYDRLDSYSGLSTHPTSAFYLAKVLREIDPEDDGARVFFRLDADDTKELVADDFVKLLVALIFLNSGKVTLAGGSDGPVPAGSDYDGGGVDTKVTGLTALAEVEDIAIIAGPGHSAYGDPNQQHDVRNRLITHCERLRYRFAILSAARTLDEGKIRSIRGEHDTTYAGLYFPWVTVEDPFSRTGELLDLPPEGFVAGVYARSDVERGVHKAPANEIVRGALRFSRNVNKGQQDTLNPEGINCLRYLEGRGYRVWGARTMTSDPEWTYVNVRRLFIYLEHSIDKSTQWVVFEPNNASLWLKVRLTVESFLLEVWRSGALMGSKPQEAFFVRCDRSTMTQSDLDNGRLVVLVGVAPTKPAEFVVFRIGQWTSDAEVT
jgi:uncharacterized protein